MRIGFHINYHLRDQTLIALFMAQQCRKLGHDIQLLARGTRARTVYPEWDKKIGNSHRNSFCELAENNDIVIWTDPPSLEQLIHAKEHNAKTVVVVIWEDLKSDQQEVLKQADTVLCPIIQAELLLRKKWELPRIHYAPIDLGIAPTRKIKGNKDRLKLILPICGSEMLRVSLEAYDMVKMVLEKNANVDLTIMASKKFAKFAINALEDLTKSFPENRITIVNDPIWPEQLKLYAKHDLTLKMSSVDGGGLVYLASILMGTPVITYDASPIRELPGYKDHAILVPCKTENSFLDIPVVQHNAKEFADCVQIVIDDKRLLEDKKTKPINDIAKHIKLSYAGLEMAIEKKPRS